MDRLGIGAALAESLRVVGADVVTVEAGAAFERRDSAYAIDSRRPDDYRRLLDELAHAGRMPRRIVHLWGVDDAEDEVEPGFGSVLALAQALGAREAEEVRLVVVTRGVQDVTGGEPLRPAKATVLGATRVIPMEYPALACRSVDLELAGLDLDAAGRPGAEAMGRLRAELFSDAAEPVVALRGPYRWVPAFEPIRLPAAGDRKERLRERGVYLITGGLGGIGLALAEHLALTLKARLVLVSRSGLPERPTWAGVAGAGANARLAARIRGVERLEAAGAEVFVARADVADREQMAGVLAETERRFGAVHGVVHAAGVAGGGLIQLKRPEQAASVLAPKVAGTLVLRELLQDRALDFILLCSSLTGVLGAVGQADYTAANAFLDAFAQDAARSRRGPPVVSIAWDAWKEAGMAVDAEVPPELRERRSGPLGLGLTNAEGVEVFRRALASGLPRLLVSTRALEERLADRRPRGPAVPTTGSAPAARPRHARPPLQNEHVPPRTALERVIVETWQELLRVEPVGVTDNFFELGGESLGALRLVALLKEKRGLSISLVRLYEAPTIELLARHLEGASEGASSVGTSGRRGEARAEAMARRQRARRG
jgi:NAD(P)-dependent dehydrogenase (short-subunit alcohol dehydrogenase family)/aryl carrier-like protein